MNEQLKNENRNYDRQFSIATYYREDSNQILQKLLKGRQQSHSPKRRTGEESYRIRSRNRASGITERTKRDRFFLLKLCASGCLQTFQVVGEDWFYLFLLGVIMALLSWVMDKSIEKIKEGHMSLYKWACGATWVGTFSAPKWTLCGDTFFLWSYLAWCIYTVGLVLFTAFFVNWLAPQACGSGIPEMKTILKGIVLKEYLTMKTLFAKMVGLTFALGSGLPIGKEGPFVHVASIVAAQLSQLVTTFKGIYENESRNSEMLAAACAVGVACTFGAPVGGVLFSIEVTSVYFAVRNYWRGFFAAACSALAFRLADVFFSGDDASRTVMAFMSTDLPSEDPWQPEELLPFLFIAIVCGVFGALFVATHRAIVNFLRTNPLANKVLSINNLIYPFFVALLTSTLTYPLGFGRFIAGHLGLREALNLLFNGFSFAQTNLKEKQINDTLKWFGEYKSDPNIFISLLLYSIVIFFLAALANTVRIPAGVFIPSLVIGAAVGRLFGEAMFAWFPYGIHPSMLNKEGKHILIKPGVYAVIGAASFTGAVTHTVSVAVIIYELTGQVSFILPVMLTVVVANGVAAYLQPSIYDSIIEIKHLPYLPDIPASNSIVHTIHVEMIMVKIIAYLSCDSTYRELQALLSKYSKLRAFPLVDHEETMILLGSVTRRRLLRLLNKQVGDDARQQEARHRHTQQLKDSMNANFEPDRRPSILPPNHQTSVSQSINASMVSAQNSVDRSQRKNSRFIVTRVSKDEEGKEKDENPPDDLLSTLQDDDSESQNSIDKIMKEQTKTDKLPEISEKPEIECSQMQFVRQRSKSQDEGRANTNNKYSTFHSQHSIKSVNDINVNKTTNSQNQLTIRLQNFSHAAQNTITSFLNTIRGQSMKSARPVIYDLVGDERLAWEDERLDEKVHLDELEIDPAPFQLVERTSLYKAHSLFSLLGLNRAYVTNCGRLVGVVALRELRLALTNSQKGIIPEETEEKSLSNNEDADDMDVVVGQIDETLGQEESIPEIQIHKASVIQNANSE